MYISIYKTPHKAEDKREKPKAKKKKKMLKRGVHSGNERAATSYRTWEKAREEGKCLKIRRINARHGRAYREVELSRRLSGSQTQCATAEFAVDQHW